MRGRQEYFEEVLVRAVGPKSLCCAITSSGSRRSLFDSIFNITIQCYLEDAGRKVDAYFEETSKRQSKVEVSEPGKSVEQKPLIQ